MKYPCPVDFSVACISCLTGRCPRMAGYVYNNIFDSCYRYHAANSSQQLYDYNPTCELVRAELIKIDSKTKQQHIVKHLSE